MKNARIIEKCLSGRRTAWPDPFKAGRDGSQGLTQVIEMHSPLKLFILMLGTNDYQCTHSNNAWLSAQGMANHVGIVRQSPIEPGMPLPEILIVAPPAITKPRGLIAAKFEVPTSDPPGRVSNLKESPIHSEHTTSMSVRSRHRVESTVYNSMSTSMPYLEKPLPMQY